ncbi:hypothetical protein E2562_014503 [Oryza meyeriana var. granulata]|uniref:Uncharacterized protein n=1 Tax=Oryza meyeriana var. granulata TaxID=110450 RepID=A0A6G1EIR7_9ORYZ|nr:hypothetical protein E2562_014503 [Oryza meyeriana var. granulata]
MPSKEDIAASWPSQQEREARSKQEDERGKVKEEDGCHLARRKDQNTKTQFGKRKKILEINQKQKMIMQDLVAACV